jgi:hypothetical protein
MTRLEIGCGSRVPAQRRVLACYDIFAAACAAIFRKQSRHTQSSPSTGIGSRAASSAHQHGPAGLQVNAVPHREQAMRRDAGSEFPKRFVINRTELRARFSSTVHPGWPYIPPPIYAQDSPEERREKS